MAAWCPPPSRFAIEGVLQSSYPEAVAGYSDVFGACSKLAQLGFAMVAIDGLGGAGKSTLARRLQADLAAVTIVEMDDFYRPMAERQREQLSPVEGVERFFDWQRLRDEVLAPLRAGRTAHFRAYNWDRGTILDQEVAVEPHGVVIIEGVYTIRPQLRALWDLRVFLEVPRALRLARMLARAENTPAQIARFMAAEDYYFATFAPNEVADIIVNDAALGS